MTHDDEIEAQDEEERSATLRNPGLLHCPLGTRPSFGQYIAAFVEGEMRERAVGRTEREKETQPLCPGCCEVSLFYALVSLADNSYHDRQKLATSMIGAFTRLYEDPSDENLAHIERKLEALMS